jgi:uncharacterized protein (DUF488 family)
MEMTFWSVGHSTRSIEQFVEIVQEHDIALIADVRRFPGSRRHPQFGQVALAESLQTAGIGYVHFPELGGRRQARKDSPNTAWRSAAFRGYADYMMTTEFHAGIERVLSLAARNRVAIMCAEAVWWQCHRSLIADFLKALGNEVIHATGPGRSEPHPFTSAARVVDGALTYSLSPDLLS